MSGVFFYIDVDESTSIGSAPSIAKLKIRPYIYPGAEKIVIQRPWCMVAWPSSLYSCERTMWANKLKYLRDY